MKKMIIDTNIYGLALERKEVANILVHIADEKQKLEKRFSVLGFKVINDEIDAITNSEPRTRMKELYYAVISGEIRLTSYIESLALEYFKECKDEKAKITMEDCQIVASATAANVEFIVTDNRKTMRSPKALDAFTLINKNKKLRNPNIISFENLKSLVLSSNVP